MVFAMNYAWRDLPPEQEKVLLEPYHYICKEPGKEFRPQLLSAFNQWLDTPATELATIQRVVQMLHSASLLIDDIEDGSAFRRGVPAAHKVYGVASTINAANYVYFQAMDLVKSLGNFEALSGFIDLVLELHRGQGLDIYWRDNNKCPSEQEYRQMVLRKTGGLFHLGVRLMQPFSQNKTDLTPLLDALGMYYQLRDDYLNVTNTKYMEGKIFCEDLTEGKFSYPIIHSIHARPGCTELLHILRQHTEDVEVKRYALKLMRETGSFEYTKRAIREAEQVANAEIARLGGNKILEGLMQQLASAYQNDGISAELSGGAGAGGSGAGAHVGSSGGDGGGSGNGVAP